MRFDDYHRTVIGYHGTRLSVALDIVNRKRNFHYSRNRDDWLGHGVYFWEYAPQQALWWAERRQKRQNWNEPVAILASMIRLGFCWDLLEPENLQILKTMHERYVQLQLASRQNIPKNFNHHKYLDCAVFQYAYAIIEDEQQQSVDSTRAVYVPTGKDKRIWPRSWISQSAHIQICVRNERCILGTWLNHPTHLEESDATLTEEFSAKRLDSEAQGGNQEIEKDDHGRTDPSDGQSKSDDSSRSG